MSDKIYEKDSKAADPSRYAYAPNARAEEPAFSDEEKNNNGRGPAAPNNNNNQNNYKYNSFHQEEPRRKHPDTFDHEHYIQKPGEFTFPLMSCCKYGSGFCCEGYCCYYCNLARQCGIGSGDRFAQESSMCTAVGLCLVDWLLIGVFCAPCCCGGPVSWIINCMTRSKTRERFNIDGTNCDDCCKGWCCAWCVVQQSLGEFYVWGYHPPTGCSDHAGGSGYPTPQLKTSRMA